MNNDNELLEMKEQLRSLKLQLERTTTLHEDTLRKQIKKGGAALYRRELSGIIFISIVTLCMPPILYFLQNMSIYFTIVTLVFFLFALLWEIYYFRNLKLANLSECDLITMEKNMQKYRRLNRIWLFYVGIPFILVWISWYLFEFIGNMQAQTGEPLSTITLIVLIVSPCIGGLIGGLIGFFTFYLPQMKQAKEIIEQIKEIEDEK